MKFIDLILGIVLLIYIGSVNIISSTKIAFSMPFALLGLGLIIYHFIKDKVKKSTYYKQISKAIKIIIVVGLIGFTAIEGIIIAYPKYDKKDSDYILVLGAGLTNGKTPSLILKGRLDAAIKCINDYNNTGYIVVSGGQGDDEFLSEALAMKTYLVDNGVPDKKIIMEDSSRNTSQNFMYSKEKIEEHSQKTIANVNVKIITTDFHAFRSRILAKKNGFEKIENYSSKTVWYLIPVMYIRESFAIVKSVVFD